jgi:ribosomal protein S18 acetylase RimI-like enzyme
MAGPNRDESLDYKGEIYNLHVWPAFQGRGIGQRLILEVSRDFQHKGWRSMLVWTLEENPSRRFYEKLGGRIAAQKEDEYLGFKASVLAYGWDDIEPLISFLQSCA